MVTCKRSCSVHRPKEAELPGSQRDWIAMKPPTPGMHLSRRDWLKASAAAGALLPTLPLLGAGRGEARSYHLCLNPAAVEQDPGRLRMIRDAGVDTVWLAGFFYGHQPFPEEQLRRARQRLNEAGLEADLVNVPLGIRAIRSAPRTETSP